MKKKKIPDKIKLAVHKDNNHTCCYCGKRAHKVIGGYAYEYNPLFEVEAVKRYEVEQSGRPASVFDIDIYVRFEVDHIHAESLGGTSDRENLTLSCRGCNRRKGATR